MKIKTTIATIGIAAALFAAPITTQAAEFTVVPVSMVRYSNAAAVLLTDADVNAVFMPLQLGLPVNVTGITSNGYFRVEIAGGTYYVVGIGLQETEPEGWTQQKAYAALVSLKAKYPQGSPWGYNMRETSTERDINGVIHTYDNKEGGRAFSRRVMKDIFGEDIILREGYAYNIGALKVGDFIRFGDNDRVITSINDKYITTVEGCAYYEGQSALEGWVDWNTQYSIEELFNEIRRDETTGAIIEIKPIVRTYYTAY